MSIFEVGDFSCAYISAGRNGGVLLQPIALERLAEE